MKLSAKKAHNRERRTNQAFGTHHESTPPGGPPAPPARERRAATSWRMIVVDRTKIRRVLVCTAMQTHFGLDPKVNHVDYGLLRRRT